MEPQWCRLQKEHGGQLNISYRMIGLLPSWDRFADSLHSLSRPSQMGPEWMQAARISGLPVADKIWVTDPPSSSFPACIAVKCAQDQSQKFGADYLRATRKAVMVDGKNIAKTDVLLEIVQRLSFTHRHINLAAFKASLLGTRGKELFRHDYQQAQYLGIHRSPTLLFKAGGKTIILQGYQPWNRLEETIGKIQL
jgi:putative protein-disulfide isomerase